MKLTSVVEPFDISGNTLIFKGKKYTSLSWCVSKRRVNGFMEEFVYMVKLKGIYGLWTLSCFKEFNGKTEVMIDLTNKRLFKDRHV